MKNFTKEREMYLKRKIELEKRKKCLTKKIDKEIEQHKHSCAHHQLFLIHYEKKDENTIYFPRLYCYNCGRVLALRKLNNQEYTNIVNSMSIVSKFIPTYIDDKYKICIINEAVDSIVLNTIPNSYEELTRTCKSINEKLLESLEDIHSFNELQEKFKKLIAGKKKSLKK